jgi:hypothetical protein
MQPNLLAKAEKQSSGRYDLLRPVEAADGHMIMTAFTGITQNLEV